MGLTAADVIELLTAHIGKIDNTVDRLKFGDAREEVKGIAVAFMPTSRVLEQAAASGANLLIAHEGPFFSHHDAFEETVAEDAVYQDKLRFMKEAGMLLLRYHDYPHREQPDLITASLVEALGWERCVTKHAPAAALLTIPAMTVAEIAARIKERLGIGYVRAAGDLSMRCTRIGVTVGYRGGGPVAIPLFESEGAELVICGEGPEWEAPEYVRDAAYGGRPRALIAIGHAESEMPGMRVLAERLKRRYPQLPVTFIPNEPVYRLL